MHSGLLIFVIHVLQNSSKRDTCSIYNHHHIIIVCKFYFMRVKLQTIINIIRAYAFSSNFCRISVVLFFFLFKPQCYFRSS